MIGNGNVALDVARVLAKHAVDLRSTEIADNVLAGLESSAVTDVHVFGRRGPADIKFTPIELRELGEVPDVDIVVHDEDFADADPAAGSQQPAQGHAAHVLNSWRTRESTGASRRLHLHFYHAPVEVLGDDRVEGVRFERTEPGRRRRGARHRRVPRDRGAAGLPRGRLLRHAGRRRAVRRRARRDPERRGRVVATSMPMPRRADPRPVRDRLDQARTGRPHRPHQVRRDGDDRPPRRRRDRRSAHRAGRRRRRARRCSTSARSRTRRGTAGSRWTRTSASSARAHRHTRERVKVVPRDEQVEVSRADSLALS